MCSLSHKMYSFFVIIVFILRQVHFSLCVCRATGFKSLQGDIICNRCKYQCLVVCTKLIAFRNEWGHDNVQLSKRNAILKTHTSRGNSSDCMKIVFLLFSLLIFFWIRNQGLIWSAIDNFNRISRTNPFVLFFSSDTLLVFISTNFAKAPIFFKSVFIILCIRKKPSSHLKWLQRKQNCEKEASECVWVQKL